MQAGVGGRATNQGYSQIDNVRQQFTGKERDNETGLDYFSARYYASYHGRFISPDPLLSSGVVGNPQSWNRYAYTHNNPLKYVDPTGMWKWSASAGGDDTNDQLEAKRVNKSLSKKERNAAKNALEFRKRFRAALIAAAALAQSDRLTASQRGQITRALQSYGTEGVDNKVSVGVGNQGTGTGANTDGTAADGSIVVTFGSNLRDFELTVDVAHEGSHVLDNQAYNALSAGDGTHLDGRNGDTSQYESERRAYEITSLVAQAGRKGAYLNNEPRYEVWNSGWKAAERETKRAAAIDRVISAHYDGISKTNPGWTLGQIKSRAPR